MNILEWIARHIEFAGLGEMPSEDREGNLHWGHMPDSPDDSICVLSTDSSLPGSENGARIQIMVRAKTTRRAYELSQQVAAELDDFDGFLAGDGPHAMIEALNTSAGLGADTKRRELYSSNFLVRYCDI